MSQATAREPFDLVVQIGSLQPFTAHQQNLLAADLGRARHVLLAIDGATRARSIRHPFTLAEQLTGLRETLPAAWRSRLTVAALHLPYAQNPGPQPSAPQWQQAACEISGLAQPKVVFRQLGSGELTLPTSWQPLAATDAVTVEHDWRSAVLASAPSAAPDPRCFSLTPPSGHAWLTQWLQQPARRELHHEWRALQAEREAWASAPYPVTLVTVDTVVECHEHVLLIRRGREPGRGLYALPGGFIEVSETLLQSAYRELHEETGLNLRGQVAPRAAAVFDAPERSQRGRVITHAWHFRLQSPRLPELQAGDDASSAVWVPIAQLHELTTQFHDDHDVILHRFLGAPHPPAIHLMTL